MLLGLQIVMKYGRNLPTVALPISVNRFVISAPKPNINTRKIDLKNKQYTKFSSQREFVIFNEPSPSSVEKPS